MAKKIQKLKNLFPALFLGKMGDEIDREREKKILVPNFVHTRPRQENFEKNRKKKLKNLFPELFLAKTAVNRPKKGKKKFCPNFHSYSAWGRKFRKKEQKNSKN